MMNEQYDYIEWLYTLGPAPGHTRRQSDISRLSRLSDSDLRETDILLDLGSGVLGHGQVRLRI